MREFDPPIIINVRDRVTPLRKLVDWLERAGHENIVLLDNASTYEPCIEYLRLSPHDVLRLGVNLGSRALWRSGITNLRNSWFVYTDPDIVPHEECPSYAVEVLKEALKQHWEHSKCALGLYLADLPLDMPSLEWERRLLQPERVDKWKGFVGTVCGGALFDSLADTTFALYRSGANFQLQSLRLGHPYVARHDCPSWYTDRDVTDEERYYFEHAEGPNSPAPGVIGNGIVGSSGRDRVLRR